MWRPPARGNAWSVLRTTWQDGSPLRSSRPSKETNKLAHGTSFMRCLERPGQRRQSRPPKLPQGFLDPRTQVGPGLLENFTPFELTETH